MLTREADINIQKSGDFQTSNFRIKASAKAFRILSEQLYSNKILAIVRELSCNAQDSHVAAGKENVPFLVHVPNTLEPWFSIRDYGIGLSHEDVMQVYTTYFESTKTTSNDYTGCLGLGSKTPFAYTDMFSVTSFFNGIKREYSAYIGNEGFPCISLLTEETTTEENGLLVQLSINSKDFNAIYDIVGRIYTYFKNTPKIVGKAIKITTPEKFLESDSWYRAKINGENINTSMAIMGNVAYPINTGSFDYGELTTTEQSILGCHIHILFNIGELEITPSREHLSYDKVTKATIKQKLSVIKTEMENLIKKKVEVCRNGWEKACLYNEIINNSEYKEIRYIINTKAVLDDVQCQLYLNDHNNLKGISLFNFYKSHSRKKTYEKDSSYTILKANSTVLYYDDLNDTSSVRRAGYYSNQNNQTITLIQCDQLLLSELIKTLDCDPSLIKKVSDLPIPPKTVSQKQKTVQAYVFANGTCREEQVDLNTPALYVKIYRNNVQSEFINSEKRMYNAAKNIYAICNHLKITTPVYGLRVSNLDKLNSKKYNKLGWKDFYGYVSEELAKTGSDFQNGVTAKIDEDNYKDLTLISLKLNDANHEITKFCEKVKNYKLLATQFKEVKALYEDIKSFKTTEKPFDYFEEVKAINEKYPVLEFSLSKWGWEDEPVISDLINYIKLKDKN